MSDPQPRTDARSARLAFAALLAGNLALAFGPWLVRLADVGPVAAAFWRLAIAVPFLLMLTAAVRQPLPRLSLALIAPIALGGWFFAADLGAWHAGIHLTKLANATLFGNMSSFVFAAYGFWIARRAPSAVQGGALLLAAAGVALLVGSSYEVSPRYVRGDLLCIAAGLLYTGYLITIDRARRTMAPIPLLALATVAAAPPLLLASILLGESWVPRNWTPLVILALGSQVVGQGLLVYAMGHLKPLVVGLGLLTQPAVAAAIGWFAFGERMTALDWVGAGAIAAALVLVRLPDLAPEAAPAHPPAR